MNSVQRQYIFGLIFIGFGVYQAINNRDYLEFSLYVSAGLAFIANALTFEPKLEPHKKTLVTIAWILIISTGILLLYLIQFKWF
jgi:hypothetical protein